MRMNSEDVLHFWFQQCRPWQWFRRSESFDRVVRDRFGGLVECAVADQLQEWSDQPCSGLALVLLLDQFSRQIWRGQAKAFAGDRLALSVAQAALQRGWVVAESERPRRQFWLMPLLHSEAADVVAQAIPLLEQFADGATADVARRNLIQLQRFGRYPHRNAALGRISSRAEVLYLQRSCR